MQRFAWAFIAQHCDKYQNQMELIYSFVTNKFTLFESKYRSTLLSQSPREWQKCFELSEVRHKHPNTRFLQDILLQYTCSQTVPTESPIEIKAKEIHFSLFYFHFNNVVGRHNATAWARDKQYCGNIDFFKLLVMNWEWVIRLRFCINDSVQIWHA